MTIRAFIVVLILTLGFTGCIPKQEDVQDVLQSNAANSIKSDYKNIQKQLISFKKKLDVRNPKSYDKKLLPKINRLLVSEDRGLYLKYKDNVLDNYKDYLQIAFSKDDVVARNDYLILGLYYLIYDSYEIEDGHKIIALEYDKEKLQKLHKNLQIIKWKIKTDKDLNNEYLFLTWQNNWQIELEKKMKNNENIQYKDIEQLEYIKNQKETLLDPSNFSFEVILTRMIDSVKNSLISLGDEPKDLAIGTIEIFLFL